MFYMMMRYVLPLSLAMMPFLQSTEFKRDNTWITPVDKIFYCHFPTNFDHNTSLIPEGNRLYSLSCSSGTTSSLDSEDDDSGQSDIPLCTHMITRERAEISKDMLLASLQNLLPCSKYDEDVVLTAAWKFCSGHSTLGFSDELFTDIFITHHLDHLDMMTILDLPHTKPAMQLYESFVRSVYQIIIYDFLSQTVDIKSVYQSLLQAFHNLIDVDKSLVAAPHTFIQNYMTFIGCIPTQNDIEKINNQTKIWFPNDINKSNAMIDAYKILRRHFLQEYGLVFRQYGYEYLRMETEVSYCDSDDSMSL